MNNEKKCLADFKSTFTKNLNILMRNPELKRKIFDAIDTQEELDFSEPLLMHYSDSLWYMFTRFHDIVKEAEEGETKNSDSLQNSANTPPGVSLSPSSEEEEEKKRKELDHYLENMNSGKKKQESQTVPQTEEEIKSALDGMLGRLRV